MPMPAPLPARHALAALIALLAFAPLAAAQEYHAANVQLLHGRSFHDASNGNDTDDGRMTTVTIEHALGWRYGDSFFFLDLTSGDFADGPTGRHRMYGEWAPRLSLSKMTARRVGLGVVKDVLIAASLDRGGDGFWANLVGVGADLRVPGLDVAQLNVYHRKDAFNDATYQVTGVWSAPLTTGPLQWSLAGYVDIAGTDAGTDVLAQPQLLLDLGALAGKGGRLHGGVEWYLHSAPGPDTNVPQAMVRWSFD
jgi:nucleoside-specific outer membrane channel protein Tsx